ncbi:DUF2179 domain-containing protein [Bacillus salacetis]|uniref:UPF0316 protein D3H55_02575 n=1 Tax=Bacillus salacetis TaxID=2315464 RepID=A0A3A1R5W5_9BACI|nr:DUF2179 domain-containing protein [Bacillus salacetis]RIW38440.1 DUF2179 domain-containing protein [Bacillus salacetis]
MIDILLIFALQLVYVPILTLRTIFLVKNMSVAASSFGFLEALIYVFGLALVFSGDQSLASMLVYALGFGVGLYIGSKVENKLAIGYTSIVVNLMEINERLIEILRNEGFGVTVFEGMGRDSKRYQLEILTKRNREDELLQIVEELEPRAFIISYEPRRFKGGFLVKAMKKRMKKKQREASAETLQSNN